MRRVCVVAVLGLAGCGGGGSVPTEPSGNFPVKITRASFPGRQHMAAESDLVLAVRNTGGKTIPDLAVTVWTGDEKASHSFSTAKGPVWLLTEGFPRVGASTASAGADAASTDTYVFGSLAPGASRTLVWRVTPVQAGTFALHYAVAAGLNGARAVGDGVTRTLPVRISARP